MKLQRHGLRGLLGLLVSCQASLVLAAAPDDPLNTCAWANGQPGPMTFRRNVGTLYVPRDARVGTVLGSVDMFELTRNEEGLELRCNNLNGVRLEFNARNSVPIFSGPLHHVRADNSFRALDGRPYVPFDATWETRDILSPFTPVYRPENWVTLIKTGPMDPGQHLLDGRELFSGFFTAVNKGMSYGIIGTVIQAQCSLSGNPVSADPVQLGDWERSDFTHPGYTTTNVPFSITLSQCDTDPSQGDFATAHIKLDGVKGSLPIDPVSNGVFSLTSDSTASGVGIQVLKDDGNTPIELGTAVPLIPISAGTTLLNFNARFYQTGTSQEVRPGSAKGALNFTITYQ